MSLIPEDIGKPAAQAATQGLAVDISDLIAGLHSLLDRIDGATLTIVDGGFKISLRPWTPKPKE